MTVEELWNEYGACRSCGWHALLVEYTDNFYEDYMVAKENGKEYVEYSCLSKNDENSSAHRGVRIPVSVIDRVIEK